MCVFRPPLFGRNIDSDRESHLFAKPEYVIIKPSSGVDA